jgi:hypothetical protein
MIQTRGGRGWSQARTQRDLAMDEWWSEIDDCGRRLSQ